MTPLARRWQYTANDLHAVIDNGTWTDTRVWRGARGFCAHLLAEAEQRVPTLDAFLCAVAPDGYPGGGDGGSGQHTATEAAMLARWKYRADHDRAMDAMQHLSAIANVGLNGQLWSPQMACIRLDQLLKVCDKYERSNDEDKQRVRCTGGAGEAGYLEWGRPECDNIADRDRKGMCLRCYTAGYRWTRRQDVA